MRIRILIVSFVAFSINLFGQLTVRPIPQASRSNTSVNQNARLQEQEPLRLPFWDDFSYYSKKRTIESLWESYASVSINDGTAVNPLSLKVATFDGYDANGKPYKSGVDIALKGFGDELVSRPIDLTLVPINKRSTVYLSFFCQAEGNGELPDLRDRLVLYFKSPQGWEEVATVETINTSEFVFKSVFVDPKFFHAGFQFQIRNFGRLSGPYDTWNIDYVYLNTDRNPTDSSVPDRAIAKPLTSLLKQYWSMPYQHFVKELVNNFNAPSFGLYNFKKDNNQPVKYFSSDTIISYTNGVRTKTTHALEISNEFGLQNLQFKEQTISKLPLTSHFDKMSDSVTIKLKVGLESGDNDLTRDYTANYSPIDFRNNDTISSTHHLSSYYAYDDGEAEYGAGLNQPGAELAYQFDMKTTEADAIKKIDIYFPDFGDLSQQAFELRIWKTLSETAPVILYKQRVQVKRSAKSKFVSYKLDPAQPVSVQGTFFIGWKQLTTPNNPRMEVGLDTNTDSGDKIFYNFSGIWQKNVDIKGSLMIRPVFGKGADSVVTNVANENIEWSIYPNPSNGVFYVPKIADQIAIYDSFGSSVEFIVEDQQDRRRVEIVNRTGFFIVRMVADGKRFSNRIIVRD
jgi:hypothetical protein